MSEVDRKTVLAIDDNQQYREMIAGLLEGAGVNCQVASGAEAAIGIIQSTMLDGVITDGLNGEWQNVLDATRERSVPIVLVSADPQAIENAGLQGMPTVRKRASYKAFSADFCSVIQAMLAGGAE